MPTHGREQKDSPNFVFTSDFRFKSVFLVSLYGVFQKISLTALDLASIDWQLVVHLEFFYDLLNYVTLIVTHCSEGHFSRW